MFRFLAIISESNIIVTSEAYLESNQTSKIDRFAKMVNYFYKTLHLRCFTKHYISDILQNTTSQMFYVVLNTPLDTMLRPETK